MTFFVNHRIAALAVAIMLVCTGAFIFPRLGSEFTPTLQEGSFVLRLQMSPSISLNESKRITMITEKRLMKIPEIKIKKNKQR